jgi:hypothetical protein
MVLTRSQFELKKRDPPEGEHPARRSKRLRGEAEEDEDRAFDNELEVVIGGKSPGEKPTLREQLIDESSDDDEEAFESAKEELSDEGETAAVDAEEEEDKEEEDAQHESNESASSEDEPEPEPVDDINWEIQILEKCLTHKLINPEVG